MKDKYGNDFADLCQLQLNQLLMWQGKLVCKLYCEVADYVICSNRAAATPDEAHRVYRGQDLVQIILEWPNLSPAYAAKKTKVEDGI